MNRKCLLTGIFVVCIQFKDSNELNYSKRRPGVSENHILLYEIWFRINLILFCSNGCSINIIAFWLACLNLNY